MTAFQGRITIANGGEAALAASGLAVVEALQRLESGERAVEVVGPDPLDLAAVLAFATLGDDESEGPALTQRPATRPRLIAAASEDSLADVAPGASRPSRLALAAGLLQILDAWDASHEAAQEAEDRGERRFSAYWHGIAHRREPDAGNASYWFRRVGRHPLFPTLALAARPLIDRHGDPSPSTRLLGRDGWDPFAMIDLCTRARRGTEPERLARRLQRLEMAMLLEATAAASG